jgi:RHS repeat-associated protein
MEARIGILTGNSYLRETAYGSTLEETTGPGDWYGRVSYFHAGGIDKPLLITKENVGSLVRRDTWRGLFHAGTSSTTGMRGDCMGASPTGCIWAPWPGWRTTASHSQTGSAPNVQAWFGGLVDGMRDASGQIYMRNRYYDQTTGEFAQTEPIGLAGGLNCCRFAKVIRPPIRTHTGCAPGVLPRIPSPGLKYPRMYPVAKKL